MKSKETIQDRMFGCLYGQAIGNALGIITELIINILSDRRQLRYDGSAPR